MSFLGLAPIFWSIVYLGWFVIGLYVYVALIRQISIRSSPPAETTLKRFGAPEALVAALIMSLLVIGLIKGSAPSASELNTRELISNFILTAVIVFVLAAFLVFRGFDLDALAGFSKVGFVRVAALGAMLLFLAYPLIGSADIITQYFLGHSSRQNIVELFSGSPTMQQRVLVIILAVAVAPVAEELVFRFFLYGVLRRYFGVVVAILINSLLFAAVHQHLPSFAPLFVLAGCFTLAYEWSGSILISMTMHSLFNSINLITLAFPSLSQQ